MLDILPMTRDRPGATSAEAELQSPAPLTLSLRHQDRWWIATVAGEVDIATEPLLRDFLGGLLDDHGDRTQGIVDLSDLSFCDARGISVLVGARVRAVQQGDELRMVCPPGRLLRLLRLARLTEALPLYPSIAAALSASGHP
ncbi:STAS domain-containing protein [Streptomyces sp. RB6PN25]|uniref:Anti-sigma factor antagonist n=1 Tax=Streptomyces humicola TaxID=2953240 RepID=A0ABT1Q194_9ACTN|nr:STAS domain-containing protein [Streptomyces humicola]MCQ4083689.1 STAS domain-containing protein [Streptomyces humicola]